MIHTHTISFKNAFRGLITALKTQPNFRIHLLLALISLSACFYLQVANFEFLIIVFLIVIGLTIETLNTAIEATTDAIDTKWRTDIGLAKDIAAGAMLMFSLGAASIALYIFIPKIVLLVSGQ